jgi:Major tropism determinant N-terminal domain
MSLRIRRGTEAQRYTPGAPPTGIVFDPGELAWCLDTKKLYIGDGVTPGGVNVLKYMAGVGVSFNNNTQALDFSQGNLTLTTANIAEDVSRKYFTDERAQDAVGAALTAGNSYNSGITFTYDDANNRITAVATGTQIPNPTLPADIGKYLTLDNSGNPVWHNPPIPGGLSIPSFTGNGGKFLTTGGDNLSWGNVSVSSLVNGAFHVDLDSAGNLKTSGSIKLPSTADITRETGVGSGVYASVLGGLSSVSADTSPSLGGNLAAGNHNISNAGAITANSVSANLVTANTGLGGDLSLNGNNINGSGNISITGSISANLISNLEIIQLLDEMNPKGYLTTTIHRGTFQSPSAVQAGDELGGLLIKGYTTSSKPAIAGLIGFIVDDTAVINGGDYIKSKIILSATTDTDQNPNNALILDSSGSVTTNAVSLGDGSAAHPSLRFTTDGSQDSGLFHPGDGQIGVSINGTEKLHIDNGGLRVNGFMKVAQVNGALPSPPEAGMIVLDGTTFKGYNGSTWVALN